MQYKLGKKPFVPKAKDFLFKNYEVTLLNLPPRPFGYGTIYSDWGMLGNDTVGDCVPAGGDHETMLWNKLAKHPVSFTRANALADYSAITGYDPNDPSTDQGTEPRAAFDYRRVTGLIDSAGKRHKIDAFVQISNTDFDLMLRCVFTFGVVGMGFEFPESAMDQFNNGEVWDVVNGAQIDGGHYVPVVGCPVIGEQATVITWGKRQVLTKAFFEKYCDEAWVPLTKESLLPATNVRGVDWATLQADLNSL